MRKPSLYCASAQDECWEARGATGRNKEKKVLLFSAVKRIRKNLSKRRRVMRCSTESIESSTAVRRRYLSSPNSSLILSLSNANTTKINDDEVEIDRTSFYLGFFFCNFHWPPPDCSKMVERFFFFFSNQKGLTHLFELHSKTNSSKRSALSTSGHTHSWPYTVASLCIHRYALRVCLFIFLLGSLWMAFSVVLFSDYYYCSHLLTTCIRKKTYRLHTEKDIFNVSWTVGGKKKALIRRRRRELWREKGTSPNAISKAKESDPFIMTRRLIIKYKRQGVNSE